MFRVACHRASSPVYSRGIHSSGIMSTQKSIFDFTVTDIHGKQVALQNYQNKVCLVVNVASKCGLTKQYAGLQQLHEKYRSQGLAVLGFPSNQFASQEPGTEQEILKFTAEKYNVTFDLFKKIDVNGETADPLWKFLKDEQHGIGSGKIKWNFTKFLTDRQGKPIKRFGPTEEPEAMVADIEAALRQPESKL